MSDNAFYTNLNTSLGIRMGATLIKKHAKNVNTRGAFLARPLAPPHPRVAAVYAPKECENKEHLC